MDATFLRKTFALIAKGLVEKEQLLQKEPMRYPYSKALQHGINMFLAASHQIGAVQPAKALSSIEIQKELNGTERKMSTGT